MRNARFSGRGVLGSSPVELLPRTWTLGRIAVATLCRPNGSFRASIQCLLPREILKAGDLGFKLQQWLEMLWFEHLACIQASF